MSTDHRLAARAHIDTLISKLQGEPDVLRPLIEECESLARAITAFHIEGIRFRMFNVDRLLSRGELAVPPEAPALFADARRELEAAGFHTRSH